MLEMQRKVFTQGRNIDIILQNKMRKIAIYLIWGHF